jgi:hypothetical protein
MSDAPAHPDPGHPDAGGSDAAGEGQRQQAVDRLCQAFADDVMGVDEFERRVDLVHRATTARELERLLADLPTSAPPAVRTPPSPAPQAGGVPAPRPAGRHPTLPPESVRPTSFVVGVMGGASRKGTWRPARTNYAIGVMGGFELDFREAILPPGVTEVRVFAFWGGGDIIVPPDVAVEMSAMGFMGGFEETHDAPSDPSPDAPVIRITGLAIMGGAEVSVRYPGETKRDARRRKRDERRARKRLKGADARDKY